MGDIRTAQPHLYRERSSMSCRLLNPASGDVFALPEGLAEHRAQELDIYDCRAAVLFGQAASTREYKVFRVLDKSFCNDYPEQLCEVFTLGGSSDARWRRKKASLDPVDMHHLRRVVVNGIVYFFRNEVVGDPDVVASDLIASFDLNIEEWRRNLREPLSSLVDYDDFVVDYVNLPMTSLNGCLVVVHRIPYSSMDLWFLMDFENGLWVKQHRLQVNLSVQGDEFLAHPSLVLNDGRIVTYIGTRGLLRIYNPRTSTYTYVAEMGPFDGFGLCTGNLLRLVNDAR